MKDMRIKISILCFFILSSALLSWMSLNHTQHGWFGISRIGTINILGKMIQYGYTDSFRSASTTPEDGLRIPKIILNKVVLPEPFGPTTARKSPSETSKETDYKTLDLPKEKQTSLTFKILFIHNQDLSSDS